jgi:hypothetical protein
MRFDPNDFLKYYGVKKESGWFSKVRAGLALGGLVVLFFVAAIVYAIGR